MGIVAFLDLVNGFREEDMAQRKAHLMDLWAIQCARSGKDMNDYLKSLGE